MITVTGAVAGIKVGERYYVDGNEHIVVGVNGGSIELEPAAAVRIRYVIKQSMVFRMSHAQTQVAALAYANSFGVT